MSHWRLYLENPWLWLTVTAPLGLSPLRNFDKALSANNDGDSVADKPVIRYGKNGITTLGARRVRNAAFLLERDYGRSRCVFATCTVPSLPIEQMRCLHEGWHKVVDAYRRKLTRLLKENGLSCESVTVVEVQEKRYQRTGIPVLHIHTVFCGKDRSGKWILSPEAHDEMWRTSLAVVVGDAIPEVSSACNLQRVKKSAEGYLGKYMTKGSKLIRALVRDGFEGWLPKQWFACSRSLTRRINDETRDIGEFAEWLNDVAEEEGRDIWLWHRNIRIELPSGDKITIARYGKLSIRQIAEIHAYYSD